MTNKSWHVWEFVTTWQSVMEQQQCHYNGVRMGAVASLITSLTIVYSIVYSDADQRKHQSSASLAFEWGIHWGPVNSPHKWPVMRKMFPFDDVIMQSVHWKLWQKKFICEISHRAPFRYRHWNGKISCWWHFVIVCTGSCQSNNFWYIQVWKICQSDDNLSISVQMICLSY